MSLPFYLTFIAASCVLTFGINGQGSPVTMPLPPQNFLSSNNCPYSSPITCPTKPTFRPIDGSCNTPGSPYIGKSVTPYRRYLISMNSKFPINKTLQGHPLPSPRKISLDLFKPTPMEDPVLSAIAPTFARFVEHDLFETKLLDASLCCTPSQSSGVCDNIIISNTDAFFGPYLRTCLPKGKFVDSPTLTCKTDVPQQVNKNTHTLDLSNIYGPTKKISDRLRTKTDGLLKVSATKNLLPVYALPECIISSPNPNNEHCFDAGDLRVNIDPLIMTMYTIWVRHHNAVAKKLKLIIPDYSDENIFQTARKIVIAQYQHIVYNELLKAFDNKQTAPSNPTSYSATVKPIIFNTFSLVYTAIVDSMVPSAIKMGTGDIQLNSAYYKPAKLFETDGIKKMLEAMQLTKAESIDSYVVTALTNSYLQRALGSGTDKVALNLQQSRENRAPVYAIFYHLLNKITDGSLNELQYTTELQKLYPNVQDVELLPGLFHEKTLTDTKYGKSTKKIMDSQFAVLKYGDPFFYSHAGVLTPEQFAEIKGATLAKIICDNSGLLNIHKNALQISTAPGNEQKKCSELLDIKTCTWTAVTWSDWVDLGCSLGYRVFTRICNNLPGSKCLCVGSAIKYELCPLGQLQNIVKSDALKKINDTFYENFGPDGKPLNPNKPDFAVILKELTP